MAAVIWALASTMVAAWLWYRSVRPPVDASVTAAVRAGVTGGKPVIWVNGEPITESEFAAFIQTAPEDARRNAATSAGRRALAEEIVKLKLLEQEGKKIGVTDDPEFTMQLWLVRSQLTASQALQRLINDRQENRLRVLFEKEKKTAVSLRHVVVAYEGGTVPPRVKRKALSVEQAILKASAIATKLRAGADFAAVAMADSDDLQTASKGGSLGGIRPDMLPPEIATVVDRMAAGSISDPVKTQFGVHIFKVEVPSLDDLRALLAARLHQDITEEVIAGLRKTAKVELDQSFFPPGS